MLNKKIEAELRSKDSNNNTIWLLYYSATIFVAVGLFTSIVIAIYFPADDDADFGDNQETENPKGNSCAFRDVLL